MRTEMVPSKCSTTQMAAPGDQAWPGKKPKSNCIDSSHSPNGCTGSLKSKKHRTNAFMQICQRKEIAAATKLLQKMQGGELTDTPSEVDSKCKDIAAQEGRQLVVCLHARKAVCSMLVSAMPFCKKPTLAIHVLLMRQLMASKSLHSGTLDDLKVSRMGTKTGQASIGKDCVNSMVAGFPQK